MNANADTYLYILFIIHIIPLYSYDIIYRKRFNPFNTKGPLQALFLLFLISFDAPGRRYPLWGYSLSGRL